MNSKTLGLAAAGLLAFTACGDDAAVTAERVFQQHMGAARTEVGRHHQASMQAADMGQMMAELGTHEGSMNGHMTGMHAQMPMMQGCGGMGMMGMGGMGMGGDEMGGMDGMGMHGMMDDADAMMQQHRADVEAAADLAGAQVACGAHAEQMTAMLDAMAEHLEECR